MKSKFFLLLNLFTAVLAFAASEPRSGEEIFKQACATCHATQFPNAPQAHDVAAWQHKYAISQAQAKQIDPSLSGKDLEAKTDDVLVSKVKNGNKAMPPKGLCNDCTDQEYLNAIKFMMAPANQQK